MLNPAHPNTQSVQERAFIIQISNRQSLQAKTDRWRGVLSPTPLSLCHRTYGVGEDRGCIRLRDEPGARRQLAGAGPDAAGPDQDADPERSFVHGLREAKTVQRAWHVHVREHDPHIRAGWSATAIPTSCTRPKSYASPRTCRL